ncbi:MAG: tail fiber domain-containing protein [Bacteroidia bacterium]|nr:tail fiber domain-containing protein [Bacteroidia bacterium]
MKAIFIPLVLCFICASCSENIFAQVPHAFNYQAIVRNNSGNVIPNQNVSFRINILQGSSTGSLVYSEEHSSTTNPFGLVNLEVGNGANPSGNFSTIDWGNNSYYIKIELDISGGSNYTVMGTNQLLSVPYALYSPGNYKAGNGISISNDTIKNISPNQLVTLTNGSGISVTGTYPDFTITNTNPDQTISLTGTGATTVMGTYPNYTINSTDNNTTYSAGAGININGSNQIINTAQDQTVVLTNGNGISITGTYPGFSITNTNPDQAITLNGTGATTVTGTYPNFTINSTDNNTTYSAGTGLLLSGDIFSAVFGTGAGMVSEGNHAHSDYTAGGINGNVQFNNNGTFGGNTDLFWDNANSRLGIGTSNPTASLHLNGTLRITDDSEGAGKIFTSDANGVGSWQTPAIGSSNGNTNYIPKFISANSLDNSLLYQNGNYIGLGTTTPSGRFMIQQDLAALDNEPIFEVKDKSGQTVMVLYKDSVHFFVKDPGGAKAQNRGCFAVSGKSDTKSFTNNYLLINPDSTRIYTTDTTMGFGIKNIGVSSKTSYMKLTPDNYFIGYKSGNANTTGMYNNYMGYETGLATTSGYYNVFVGYNSGKNNIDGSSNTFLGYSAGWNSNGQSNVAVGSNALGISNTGSSNVAVGNQSLAYNTGGEYNVALGNNSLYYNSVGTYNVAVGVEAIRGNSSGNRNIAMGYQSLYSNSSGNENVALGYRAGYTNTTGNNNVFLGYYAGYTNNANYNVFLGYEAGRQNTSGANNSFMGYQAGRDNTTGESNVFIGNSCGYTNTGGNQNVFLGFFAGFTNNGNYNVFLGSRAGYSNTSGWGNTANGYFALYSNTTGINNVANGYQALYFNTGGAGNYNVANGYRALYNNTEGYHVANGYQALYSNTTGTKNTANGYQAMYSNTTGNSNVAEGNAALYSNTTGNSNVAIGDQAMYYGIGYGNTAIGRWSLYYNTGDYNTALGFGAFFSPVSTSYTNSTALGNSAAITASNQVRVGNNSVTSIGGYAAWTNLSDKRFKKDVAENVPGLAFIMKLKPITYHLDMNQLAEFLQTPDSLRLFDAEKIKESILQTGFVAQDVEKAANELGFDFSGVDKPKNERDYYGLRYAEFTVPLVKAVQEQQKMIEELNDKIQNLEKENTLIKSDNTILKNDNTLLKSKIQEIDNLKAEIANIKLSIGTSSNK